VNTLRRSDIVLAVLLGIAAMVFFVALGQYLNARDHLDDERDRRAAAHDASDAAVTAQRRAEEDAREQQNRATEQRSNVAGALSALATIETTTAPALATRLEQLTAVQIEIVTAFRNAQTARFNDLRDDFNRAVADARTSADAFAAAVARSWPSAAPSS
jgi:hypothetical protein